MSCILWWPVGVPVGDLQPPSKDWGKPVRDIKIHPGGRGEIQRVCITRDKSHSRRRAEICGRPYIAPTDSLLRFPSRSTRGNQGRDCQGCRWHVCCSLHIFEKLTNSNTRFLLASLHLDDLNDKTTPGAVRAALAKLRSGSEAYDHVYQTTMERIAGQHRGRTSLAKQVLSWITCA